MQDKEVDRLMSIDVDRGRILGRHLQGALPAIALDGHVALSTAYMNDCEPLLCFAQQVNGYGCEDDDFWAFPLQVTVKMFFSQLLQLKLKV